MKKNLILVLSFLFIISCEITSQDKVETIITESNKAVIYNPKDNLETNEEDEDIQKINVKDFSGIEKFQYKKLSSLKSEFGDFNFSKIEMIYEFHRYNADKCRIFIQNNTNDKDRKSVV